MSSYSAAFGGEGLGGHWWEGANGVRHVHKLMESILSDAAWLERTESRTHPAGSASSTTASWTRTMSHGTAWSLPSSLSR